MTVKSVLSMKRKYRLDVAHAFDLAYGTWLMRGSAPLLSMMDNLQNINLSHEEDEGPEFFSEVDVDMEASAGTSQGAQKSKKIIVIDLLGPMVKYSNWWAWGTLDLADYILSQASNDRVAGFVLNIDSPGGNVSAVAPLIQAINKVQELGKPIIAHCDMCASAALWVASQCDAIFMDNKLSDIGSLGAYATIYDDRENKLTGEKIITIYADESEDKNKSVRDALEGDYKQMKAELSEIITEFRNAVFAGRPDLKKDEEGVATGAMFNAQRAIEIGLADGMMTLDEAIENVIIRADI